MKYLKYGWRFFKKWWGLNIILAAEIVVTLLMLNISIARSNMQYQAATFFSNLTEYKGVYYAPKSNFEFKPEDSHLKSQESVDFGKLTGVESIVYIQKMSFLDETGQEIQVIVYPDYLIDKLPLFFDQAVWQKMKSHEEGTVPVVVLDGLYSSGLHTKPMVVAGSEQTGEIPQLCTVDVLGSARTGGQYFSCAASGDELNCLSLFPTYDDRFMEAPLLFTLQSVVEPYSKYIYWSMPNVMIFFEQDITEEEYDLNLEKLRETGIVDSFQHIYEEGVKTIQTESSSLLALTFCLLTVAIIGLVSLIILNTLRHLPVFSIYFLGGCSWNKCLFIIMAYLLYIGGLVVVGSGISWGVMILQDKLFQMQLLINSTNVYATLLLSTGIILLALLPAFIVIKMKSPIQILREKDR